LHPDRVNENKGAESALSYLLGLVEMRRFERAALQERAKPVARIGQPAAQMSAATRPIPRETFVPTPLS
jgi:hypothetical protein